MADTKTSALPAVTPADEDLVYLVDDPSGTPTSSRGTVGGIRNAASASDIRAGTAGKSVTADGIESAAEIVALSDGATIAVDWSTFLNAEVTLGGNRTLGDPANLEPGTWRHILVRQDGTGSRTLSFGSGSPNVYHFVGGAAPTLSTAAGAADMLALLCWDQNTVFVFSALDLKPA